MSSKVTNIELYASPPHTCSYLPEQQAVQAFIDPALELNPRIYSLLSRQGFRRSGNFIYRPQCGECQACIPVRLPVAEFRLSRSQKRIVKRNRDLRVEMEPATVREDDYKLYERYITLRHPDGDMYPPSFQQYRKFLLADWCPSLFLRFYEGDSCIAVMVADQLDDGLSAVYSFFEPDQNRRSLGSLSILQLIAAAKESNLAYVYLGYYVRDCHKMSYKINYRPLEIYKQGRWLSVT